MFRPVLRSFITASCARSLIAACAVGSGASAYAQEPQPAMVLTDTVEYCTHLEHLIQERPIRPPEVNRLFAEGRRMCEHGELRRGISRLRSAIWLLHHKAPVP
jgi:hypothetical protein